MQRSDSEKVTYSGMRLGVLIPASVTDYSFPGVTDIDNILRMEYHARIPYRIIPQS